MTGVRGLELRSLPIEGARLYELAFSGYGKRSEVSILAEGAPQVVISLADARMELTLACELTVTSRADDDLTVEWRIAPRADQHVVLRRAAVYYPGSDEDWADEVAQFAQGGRRRWELGWVVRMLVIRLASATDDAAS